MAEFDHAVVGAGIVGTWTALHLQKLGRRVLLLEQFGEYHSRGSSHGQSRIILSSFKEPFFVEMVCQAMPMWRQAEMDTDTTLMENVGCLVIASSEKDKPKIPVVAANMQKFCPQELNENDLRVHEWMDSLLKYDEPETLMDKSGGVLLAQKALVALQNLFRKRGGSMWSNCTVRSIEPLGNDQVRLHISSQPEEVTVQSVVVCAGTWASEVLKPFLPNLPLKPTVVRVYYFKEKKEGSYSASSGFPTLIDLSDPCIYGLPSLEYPGLVKVCIHAGVECNPNERDTTKQCPKLEAALKNYVREHFPLLEDEPAIVETCMYTLTPDKVFLIDYVPQHRNIVFGAGFSGTGFKTSPAVGRILGEMAIGVEPFLDILPYRLDRFKKSQIHLS